MSNIILKWIITSICQFLKRKNIIVMYDNVNKANSLKIGL